VVIKDVSLNQRQQTLRKQSTLGCAQSPQDRAAKSLLLALKEET
jgi:hypothetical protein